MCARRTFDPANTHRQVDLCPPPVPKALDHCLPLCESRGCPRGLRWFRSRSPITQVLKTGARTVHLNKLAVGKILAKRAQITWVRSFTPDIWIPENVLAMRAHCSPNVRFFANIYSRHMGESRFINKHTWLLLSPCMQFVFRGGHFGVIEVFFSKTNWPF